MSTLECSQCGRPAPAAAGELARWQNGNLVLAAGELDEVTPAMLLCPECVDDDRTQDYEEGDPG